jgi:hypothetical protein
MDGDELGDDGGVAGGVELCAGGGGRRWRRPTTGIGRGGRAALRRPRVQGRGARVAGARAGRARPAAAGQKRRRVVRWAEAAARERETERRREERKREERRSRAAVNITLFSAVWSSA